MFGWRRARRERRARRDEAAAAERARVAAREADRAESEPWIAIIRRWHIAVGDEWLELHLTKPPPDIVAAWPALPPGTFYRAMQIAGERGPLHGTYLTLGAQVEPPVPPSSDTDLVRMRHDEVGLWSTPDGALALVTPTDTTLRESDLEAVDRLLTALAEATGPDRPWPWTPP